MQNVELIAKYTHFFFFITFLQDLTAIGITKPGHRKRISAMISQLTEPDGIPNVRPVSLYLSLNVCVGGGYKARTQKVYIIGQLTEPDGILC